ncbi:NADH-quinone oxidoreductase subunit N [Geobacter sp. SVR]|uniref:NADH-quinone oxidoreductase subunit N n=1 Tax=Geobacter sp. SVR TaxID=2495594 RepID=UPI00143EFE1A|nr:NADH-quinone oxidoreductase subunit N [Geobacter sp. SVR]BCS55516.1 NADH-quinone oxidoreductase subunit N [Geobacter sp. SVR]GCF83519.1 NADH-quinone oxidoreductase subunit N [Geobacter sp. SVR]
MDMISIPAVNMTPILPEILLSVLAMALLLINVFAPSGKKSYLGYISFVGVVVTAVLVGAGWNGHVESFNGSVVQDNFASFFKMIFLLAAGLAILIADQYMEREDCNHGELYPLILFTVVGMMLMAAGTDLMTIFLGLEVMSVSLYVLAGFNRANVKSNEAGLKYFLLGAFSTGFLLYGMALTYGATGSTRIAVIASKAAQIGISSSNIMLLAGMLLMLTGFAFKIAAAPFHMWTPDVYEGAPTPMTAFMSAGPKAAGFAAALRILLVAFPTMQADWSQLLWILAVLTMTVGNITALRQDNIKRMLAYSSIAHAGYALVGFTAANGTATAGILFYMLSYTFMNIGAFAVLVLIGKKGEANGNVQDFAGLGFKHPILALVMTIFLFSLAGMPPTAGFIGKFYLFSGAIQKGYIWLAVIGVLNSAASVYYYLRVMVYMYMKESTEEFSWVNVTTPIALCLIISVAGTLIPGIVPSVVLQFAQEAAKLI